MTGSIKTVNDIFFCLPLYAELEFILANNDEELFLEDFLRNTKKLEGYNHVIGERTTFDINRPARIFYINDLVKNSDPFTFYTNLKCVRTGIEIEFYFRISFNQEMNRSCLIKVGQYPSMPDLELGKYKKYRDLLSNDYLKEFNKAIGLSAHGVGIGSFVYLRRVFESLIGNYYEKAKASPSWDDDKYSKGRMEDKINLLKEYLPEAVVEFRGFYSIVSKGVHELTDKECLKYFPIVKDAILAMLEQDYLLNENEKKQKELRENMNKLKSELGKK